MSKTKKLDDILFNGDHSGCPWKSPEGKIIVIANPIVHVLIEQAEDMLKLGYQLSGGIQLIRSDDGSFNGSATFILSE